MRSQLKTFEESLIEYATDPVLFVRKLLGAEPDRQQRVFLYAISEADAVAAKSGHGTGKTTSLAWAVIWFLTCFVLSRVVATAPTQRQLLDILWPEIHKWLDRSPLNGLLTWHATRVSHVGYEETWFATARTSNKPENMQGFHAPHLMVIADEASGIPQDTAEAMEGALTTPGSKLVLAGNPTRISGTFYDAFHKSRNFYRTITMSSELSDHVTKDYCDRIAAKYGRDSNFYLVRVKGEFPRSEPDVYIQLDLVEAAVVREASSEGTVQIGCDPARFGDCETVIYWREGLVVHDPIVLQGMDTMWTAGQVAMLATRLRRELKYEPKIEVMVDETGIGAGVVDALKLQEVSLWITVVPINFGGKGDEECHDTATMLLKGIRDSISELQLPDDDDTVAQLSTRKYRVMPSGKIKIESKDELRARKMPSPDRADALGLCLYHPENAAIMMSDATREALRARRARR